jgi:PAS domain S-box-containing protein
MPAGSRSSQSQAEEALRQSEERFRAILDNSQIALYKRNYRTNKYEYMSPAIEVITGYTPTEMIEMGLDDIFNQIHPADIPHVRQTIDETIQRGGGKCQFEYRFYHKNGSVRWVNEMTSIAIDQEGQPFECIGSVQDITDRKLAEEGLRESEIRLRTLIDAAPIAIALSRESKLLYVNPKYIEMHGYNDIAELIGKPVYTQVAPQSLAASQERAGRRAQNLPVETEYELVAQRKDGSQLPISAAVAQISLVDGPATIGFFQDISSRKQVEEQFKNLNDTLEARVKQRTAELEAASQELAATSYSISHNLRSPLRAMNGYSQALLEDYEPILDETARGYLGRIHRASMDMAGLIEDLLKLLSITRREIHPVEVDLSQLAHEVVSELEALYPYRKIEWIIPDHLSVRADSAMLRIMISNLLDNAIKFTRSRQLARIELGRMQQANGTVWFLKDNGVGFEMAHTGKLFVTFHRLNLLNEYEGNGVGLSIVQRIIHRHGGQIWAEGIPDEGATFYFTFDAFPE